MSFIRASHNLIKAERAFAQRYARGWLGGSVGVKDREGVACVGDPTDDASRNMARTLSSMERVISVPEDAS